MLRTLLTVAALAGVGYAAYIFLAPPPPPAGDESSMSLKAVPADAAPATPPRPRAGANYTPGALSPAARRGDHAELAAALDAVRALAVHAAHARAPSLLANMLHRARTRTTRRSWWARAARATPRT